METQERGLVTSRPEKKKRKGGERKGVKTGAHVDCSNIWYKKLEIYAMRSEKAAKKRMRLSQEIGCIMSL